LSKKRNGHGGYQVTDIADAAIIAQLLEGIWRAGVCVVATSNRFTLVCVWWLLPTGASFCTVQCTVHCTVQN
jgi:hypothetical protein